MNFIDEHAKALLHDHAKALRPIPHAFGLRSDPVRPSPGAPLLGGPRRRCPGALGAGEEVAPIRGAWSSQSGKRDEERKKSAEVG